MATTNVQDTKVKTTQESRVPSPGQVPNKQLGTPHRMRRQRSLRGDVLSGILNLYLPVSFLPEFVMDCL